MDLNVIRFQLTGLLKAIMAETTAYLAPDSVPTADKRRYAEAQAKFSRWEAELSGIMSRLESQDSWLAMQQKQNASLPRDQRYRAQQSLGDRRAAVGEAMDLANEVAARLADLLNRFGALTPVEKVQALEKLVSKLGGSAKSMHQATKTLESLLTQPQGATIRTRVDSGIDPFVMLAVIGRLLHMLALKAASKSGVRQ